MRNMIYPDFVKTWKTKLIYRFLFNLYTFERGRGSVVDRVTNFLPSIAVIFIALEYFGIYSPTITEMIIFGIIYLLSCWAVGFAYMTYSVDRMESHVATLRNPIFEDVHDIVTGKKK